MNGSSRKKNRRQDRRRYLKPGATASAVSTLNPPPVKVKSSAAASLPEITGKDKQLLPVQIDGVRCEQSREAGPYTWGISFGNDWGWRRFSRARA